MSRGVVTRGLENPGRGRRWSSGGRYIFTAGCWLPAARGGCRPGTPIICQTGDMDEARAAEMMTESAAVLRNAGSTVCLPAWQSCLWTIPSGFRHRHRRVLRRPAADRVDILMPHGINLLVIGPCSAGIGQTDSVIRAAALR